MQDSRDWLPEVSSSPVPCCASSVRWPGSVHAGKLCVSCWPGLPRVAVMEGNQIISLSLTEKNNSSPYPA